MALLGVLVASGLVPGGLRQARGQCGLSSAERSQVVDHMVRLGYFDTAHAFLRALKKCPGADRCDLASLEIDVLRGEGKLQEARDALQRFKEDCPGHPRAALGSLEVINQDFAQMAQLFEQSVLESDETKAQALRAEAKKIYETRVEKPLDELIKGLRESAKDGKDENQKRLRNQAELARINLLVVYAGLFDPGAKERKEALELGLAYATEFVDQRFTFYVMQYEAQLLKGRYLLELGRFRKAEDELALLYDITPPARPPYDPALVKAFKSLRLRAALYGARAWLGRDEPAEAVRNLERRIFKNSDKVFSPREAGADPDLRQFYIQARLEYSVALARAGRDQQGLDVIHEIIDENQGLEGDPRAQAYVIDARKALSRLAEAGVMLSGRDYYQAAIGLKSQLKFEEALAEFQRALATLREDMPEYGPLCLKEIGEINYTLGRYDESAVAFQQIFRYFPAAPFIAKAANDFLAAVSELTKARPEHAGYQMLLADAQRAYDAAGEGLGREQQIMAEAGTLENAGSFAAARVKYLEVPQKTSKGADVPFYWRAQASAWGCLVRQWEGADADGQEALKGELQKGVAALTQIREEAMKKLAEDPTGAASAALNLGLIHYHLENFNEATAALRAFTAELSDVKDPYYRCTSLAYLVLSSTRADDEALATTAYRLLSKDCPAEAATAIAARTMADHYLIKDENKKAAVYYLDYADHPTVQNDLKDLGLLMQIIQVLSDGGLERDAVRFLERAKSLAGEDDDRVLTVMEAKIREGAKEWARVIQLLEGYVKKYKLEGVNEEDPYISRSLGWAYWMVDGSKKRLANMMKAHNYYGHACYLIDTRLKDIARRTGKTDPRLDAEFWRFAYAYMYMKYHIGTRGQLDYFREINLFVNANKHKDMGGTSRKQKFLSLQSRALDRLKSAGGDKATR